MFNDDEFDPLEQYRLIDSVDVILEYKSILEKIKSNSDQELIDNIDKCVTISDLSNSVYYHMDIFWTTSKLPAKSRIFLEKTLAMLICPLYLSDVGKIYENKIKYI